MSASRRHRAVRRMPRTAGQSAVEVLLLLAALALAFGLAADGPLAWLVAALVDRHQRFTWSISLP